MLVRTRISRFIPGRHWTLKRLRLNVALTSKR